MRPKRNLPPWRRLLTEYAAILLAYIAAIAITGNIIIAIIVAVVVMLVLRWSRSRSEPRQ